MSYLKGINYSDGETLSDMVSEIRDRRFSSGYHCPHCSSSIVVRYGNYRKRKRYLCRSCNKTFTDLTSTALNYIHDKEKFVSAAKLMLSGATLEKTAKKVAKTAKKTGSAAKTAKKTVKKAVKKTAKKAEKDTTSAKKTTKKAKKTVKKTAKKKTKE